MISLRVVSPPDAEPGEIVLPLDGPGSACSVRLGCLPGASGLHLVLLRDGAVVLRAEIPAESGETVAVELETREDGDLRLLSPGRPVFTLPADSRYEPLPPLRIASTDGGLDLVFVLDGTTRRFATGDQGLVADLLLDRKEEWREQADRLSRFAEGLAQGTREPRFAVLAFGDSMPPGAVASDLAPRYHLHPREEERGFLPLDPARLQSALESVPSTPGGDFVDALADALHACRRLRWRRDARKLIVIYGDSPGHSVLHPLRRGADVCARALDIDTEVWQLHRDGVEVATIYCEPGADLRLHAVEFRRDLLSGARAQYARLASLPTLAFEASSFTPERAVEALNSPEMVIARCAALGQMVEVSPAETAAQRAAPLARA
jgi:hypothetical protein